MADREHGAGHPGAHPAHYVDLADALDDAKAAATVAELAAEGAMNYSGGGGMGEALVWAAIDVRRRIEAVRELLERDAPPAPGDLAALERELLELRARHDALPTTKEAEPEADRLYRAYWKIEERIAEAPAVTPADIAVKIRRLRALEIEHGGGEGFLYHVGEPLYRTAIEALERLAGRAAPRTG